METRIAHGMRLDWLLKLLHKARRDKLLFGGKRQCSEPEMGRAEQLVTDKSFVNDLENFFKFRACPSFAVNYLHLV